MPAPTNPPFRAEHVGSLLRPKELTQAFRAHRNGEISDQMFNAIQDMAIHEAVKLQEEVGLKMVTDGEFRRASYWAHFVERVDGLVVRDASFKFHDDHGHEVDFAAPYAEAPVRRSQSISGDEFEFLQSVTSATPKITMPSPATMHFYRLGDSIGDGVYPNEEAYFADLATVYAEEIAALAEAGCRYIQIDEVPIAMLCDPAIREKVEAVGYDPDRLMDAYVDLSNAAIAARPDGVTIGMHLCRGNFKGHYLSQGGYEPVAERLFNGINVDVFFLEYDTPRAGDFEALRYMPDDKSVVLGIVSTKTPELESADDLKRRIEDAGRYVDIDRLALSPQCGFASTVAGNPVSVDDQRAKLRLIVDVANDVWGA
jgi:5-methyltetrahydropteroyltriglutamate--homocysteine methyltransferase